MLVPFSNRNSRGGLPYITVDRQGRLCLSSKLRKELDAYKTSIELYISYDKVNKRIGVAKPHITRLTDVVPYKFDAGRGYANAVNFLSANKIPFKDGAIRFNYEGKENGWLVFKQENYDAPDQPNEVREEMHHHDQHRQ